MFERLNTGGTQLVGQEIRNCIYHGPFNEMLMSLNKNKEWRTIFGKPTEDKRLIGDDYKQNFSTAILNTEHHAAWDNIMRARHAVVHKGGTFNITFGELLTTYPKTKVVLAVLKSALDMP